jgi:hypothetical protein
MLADEADQRLAVAAALRAWRPRLLLTHAQGDRHPDHNAAHLLVTAAAFLANVGGAPLKGDRHAVERIWYFLGNPPGGAPTPDVVVDTTSTHQQKLAALRCYATQFFAPGGGHGLTEEAVEEGAAADPATAKAPSADPAPDSPIVIIGATAGGGNGDRAAEHHSALTGSDLPPTWIASEQFWDLIEARALTYGAMAGCRYGEPFLSASPPRLPLLSWV